MWQIFGHHCNLRFIFFDPVIIIFEATEGIIQNKLRPGGRQACDNPAKYSIIMNLVVVLVGL